MPTQPQPGAVMIRNILSVLAALLATSCASIADTRTAPPQRIEEAAFVRLGGIEQWTARRGSDSSKPVLLVVHGGPGDILSPYLDEIAPYEADFVVVQWDQR